MSYPPFADRFCVRMCVRERKNGAPGAIPTRDLPLRRRTLYAAELRENKLDYPVNPGNRVNPVNRVYRMIKIGT